MQTYNPESVLGWEATFDRDAWLSMLEHSNIPYRIRNFNVSVGDISARRMERWDPSIMVVSIPIERIAGIADAVDKSTAGTAETSREFKAMSEKMRSREV